MPDSIILNSADKLKRHFSARVLHQSKRIIEHWQQLTENGWNDESVIQFTQNIDKLYRYALRFGATKHQSLAEKLQLSLDQITDKGPSNQQIDQLNHLITQLNKTALRRTDQTIATLPDSGKETVYIALNNTEQAAIFNKQMRYFRLNSEVTSSPAKLQEALERHHPSILVIDLDFGQTEQGLKIVQQLQQERSTALPIIFTYQQQRPSVEQQLQMLRCGSQGLFQETEMHTVINEIDKILDTTPEAPFKVLVVDDSRSQSRYTENALNRANILCQAINDPLIVFDVLREFDPDLVLMDMYMPVCNGVELARVIRQQPEYINLPIIYLSGEEDKQLQLDAMAKAGDDFLTKPVKSNHLLTSINNRIRRARQLYNLIARDSLTGLLNHTHTLAALQQAIERQTDVPVSFVMVDIDHFKQVNDTYGHPIGDDVIRNLSLFLRQHLRKTDPIGRYGGEEFAAILIGADEEQARMVMDDIRANFEKLVHTDNGLTVSFSCGVAQWQGGSVGELVSLADQALYKSKHDGRNRVTPASALR